MAGTAGRGADRLVALVDEVLDHACVFDHPDGAGARAAHPATRLAGRLAARPPPR